MSTEAFDLGVRLRARDTGQVQPRMHTTPYFMSWSRVAVHLHNSDVHVHYEDDEPAYAPGLDGLLLLARSLPSPTHVATTPPTLVVQDRRTLRKLSELAATAMPGTTAFHVGALLDFWSQQLEMPGSPAALSLLESCRLRWMTGESRDAENELATWRDWLGLDTTGTDTMLALAQQLAAGNPNPLMAQRAEPDLTGWQSFQTTVERDADWRLPDAPTRAVMGFQMRSDAADYFERALMEDPMWRTRAVVGGHIVRGAIAKLSTSNGGATRIIVRSPQSACRLREGKTVQIVVTDPSGSTTTGSGEVFDISFDTDGSLLVHLHPHSGRDALESCREGDRVDVAPEVVLPKRQRQMRVQLHRRMQLRPWVMVRDAMPGVQSVANRVPPMDVMLAGSTDTSLPADQMGEVL